MSSIKNLGESFSAMRTVTLAAVATTLVTIVLAGGLVAYLTGVVGQRVYVVDASGTQPANAFNPDDHSQFEYRNLVRTWAGYMFAHDQYTYKDNLNEALPLIDENAFRAMYHADNGRPNKPVWPDAGDAEGAQAGRGRLDAVAARPGRHVWS